MCRVSDEHFFESLDNDCAFMVEVLVELKRSFLQWIGVGEQIPELLIVDFNVGNTHAVFCTVALEDVEQLA